jgi:hypothetical protein
MSTILIYREYGTIACPEIHILFFWSFTKLNKMRISFEKLKKQTNRQMPAKNAEPNKIQQLNGLKIAVNSWKSIFPVICRGIRRG